MNQRILSFGGSYIRIPRNATEFEAIHQSMNIRNLALTYQDTGIRFDQETLSSPDDVVDYMKGAFDERPDQEQFWIILLNQRNRPLGRFLCALGTVSRVAVHPREVFRPAVLNAASSVVVVHNHPSGDPRPSREDQKITNTLFKSSKVIDIELLDHIIIGTEFDDPNGVGFYSFFHR